MKIIRFNKINSTNDYAKKLATKGFNEGTIVIANEQTAGKGRLGRTFVSKRGGLYFSIVLRPKQKDFLFITVAAAVAVAHAIESVTNKKCDIKWVNDIYINNKKVSGILTEGGFTSTGNIDYIILGVGINIFEPKEKFPKELPLADSVFHNGDIKIFKNAVKRKIFKCFLNEFFKFYGNLEKKEYIKEYQNRSFLKGKKIKYIKDDKIFVASVLEIDDDAKLVVEVDGNKNVLSHGEIQIIGMEQLPV